jgi:hypothetical protein
MAHAGTVRGAAAVCETAAMAVRQDCRHYSTRSTGTGDQVQRCRVDANEKAPFACPEFCLFFEPRSITDAGWRRFEADDDPT